MLLIKEPISYRVYAQNMEICVEGYVLENGTVVHDINGTWEDHTGKQYKSVALAGDLAGFTCKQRLSKVDIKLLSESDVGRAYLEYNNTIGGEPFNECLAIGNIDIEEQYGGIVGLYHECIKQGKTWEELLGTDGECDILPTQDDTGL